ncbi:MAG: GxxExxY protein [Balneolaceae bacterium]|nr:MAG: GxxExxY protein [Balneolaceae bacterium]
MTENEIGKVIVNCALTVHKNLGPGLLENTYQACLLYELNESGLAVHDQAVLPVNYKGVSLDVGYRIDLWVNRKVVIELKAVKELKDLHLAQILTYLKLTDNRLGYLINFNVPRIKQGIRRVVNNLRE